MNHFHLCVSQTSTQLVFCVQATVWTGARRHLKNVGWTHTVSRGVEAFGGQQGP